MDAGSDNLNSTQAAAVVALLLVLLVPAAVAIAAWCKQRYARAVVALQASTGASAADEPGASPPAHPPEPLSIGLIGADAVPASDAPLPARRLRRRVLCVQFGAALLYWWWLLLALLLGLAAYLGVSGGPVADDSDAPAWALHVFAWPLLLWPPLVALALQAAVRERTVWALTLLAFGLFGAGLVGTHSGLGPALAIVGVLLLIAVMLSAFMRPAVRGAGPPLVAAFSFGLLVLSALLAIAAALDPTGADDAPITATDWVLAALLVAACVGVGTFAAWRMLLRLARRYQAKRFSEVQLAFGTFWALVTLFATALVLLLSFEDKTGSTMEWVALAVLVSWALWRVVLRGLLRWATRGAAAGLPPLLLLRVFKPSGRSEAFIDRFLARWRFCAPTWMIAGPDLAGAYMEPDEFFAWLRRRLDERFIRSAGEIDTRLGAIDAARDPDGRFRVAELFCANATWKPVVLAMLERAGVVLLDLREYTEQRAGTRYELRELLRRADLGRVLLLTDEAGDAPELQAAIQDAWAQVGRPGAHALRLLRVERGTDAEMDGLFRAAAEAARPGPAPNAPRS